MTVTLVGGSTATATSGEVTVPWPAGTLPGDVAVLWWADQSGSATFSGWTVDPDFPFASRTLDAGDVAADLTASGTDGAWWAGVWVTRGAAGVTYADAAADPEATSVVVPAVSGHAAPMAVWYAVAAYLQPGAGISVDPSLTAAFTQLAGSSPDPAGAEFPAGFDARVAVAGLAQATPGTAGAVTFSTAGDGDWQVWTVTLDEVDADAVPTLHYGGRLYAHATGGGASAGPLTVHHGLRLTGSTRVLDFPRPRPGDPALGDVAGEVPVRRVSYIWPAPTLAAGRPVNWEPS